HLAPLWEVLRDLVTREPATPALPALWRYAEVRPFLARAGEIISAQEAERRVLILENPALPGQSRITRTLYAGLQLILPGEMAPCHRHTQSALRFMMEGADACTAVDGEKVCMAQWDLILTPNWRWHDHVNPTNAPVVWLDGLDIPLVAALDAGFMEKLPGGGALAESRPPGFTLASFGANLRPARRSSATVHRTGELFAYPYARWREALETIRRHEHWDQYDGLKMEFTDPLNGGSLLPTISAFAQLIPTGFETVALRSTDGSVYVVVGGRGTVEIGERTFCLEPHDVFVVPAWCSRKFHAQEDLVLFSFSDRAAQESLGLWREQRC
ncbi:MAG: gentisate 1,2-dioxygenase, partial [Steroidobacteraceae bacterium]